MPEVTMIYAPRTEEVIVMEEDTLRKPQFSWIGCPEVTTTMIYATWTEEVIMEEDTILSDTRAETCLTFTNMIMTM